MQDRQILDSDEYLMAAITGMEVRGGRARGGRAGPPPHPPRAGGEPVPVEEPLPRLGVDGEVADVVRDQVLEEVRSLRGAHVEVAKAGLDDHPGAGDLIPGDGDAEEWLARAPAAGADEDITSALGAKAGVELSYDLDDAMALAAPQPPGVHHD